MCCGMLLMLLLSVGLSMHDAQMHVSASACWEQDMLLTSSCQHVLQAGHPEFWCSCMSVDTWAPCSEDTSWK